MAPAECDVFDVTDRWTDVLSRVKSQSDEVTDVWTDDDDDFYDMKICHTMMSPAAFLKGRAQTKPITEQ